MRTFLIVVVLVWLAVAGLTVLVGSDPGGGAQLGGGLDVPTPVAEGAVTAVAMGAGIVTFAAMGLGIYLRP